MTDLMLQILITLVVVLYIVFSMKRGYDIGFLKKLLSISTIILALISVSVFTPLLVGFVKDFTNLESTISESIFKAIKYASNLDNMKVPNSIDILNINGLTEQVREKIQNNLTPTILNIICGIVVFILTTFVVKILIRLLDIVDYIPMIGQINKAMGLVLGLVQSLIMLWILFTIVQVLSWIPPIAEIEKSIESAFIARYIYSHNFISNFFFALLGGLN